MMTRFAFIRKKLFYKFVSSPLWEWRDFFLFISRNFILYLGQIALSIVSPIIGCISKTNEFNIKLKKINNKMKEAKERWIYCMACIIPFWGSMASVCRKMKADSPTNPPFTQKNGPAEYAVPEKPCESCPR